ncbi:hypothetical protein QTN47_05430 [Danxiaibacter flavus]|uniref:Uncharacterized protein n=1 Tax=Danxiaibacter flavus TaxID=3049108 RepID=A0ABV3ZAQ9_9BACT|nr:hypothetical protein QNM32_05430 [Chitinophagaceae bacterium DXS]
MKFLRHITVAWLLSLMIIQSLMMLGMCLLYSYSKDAVIEKYCVNKNKPSMHCNGKCYLFKKMRQAEEKGGASEENASSFFFFVFVKPEMYIRLSRPTNINTKPLLYNQPLYQFIWSKDFFHPPLV